MNLVKQLDGRYIPADDYSYEQSKKIKIGQEVLVKKGRHPKFHRLTFAILQKGFENQERYELFEVYRKIIHIKAGYYDEVPTKDGEIYYIPQSISYENMSQEKFEKFYDDIVRTIARDLNVTEWDLLNEM